MFSNLNLQEFSLQVCKENQALRVASKTLLDNCEKLTKLNDELRVSSDKAVKGMEARLAVASAEYAKLYVETMQLINKLAEDNASLNATVNAYKANYRGQARDIDAIICEKEAQILARHAQFEQLQVTHEKYKVEKKALIKAKDAEIASSKTEIEKLKEQNEKLQSKMQQIKAESKKRKEQELKNNRKKRKLQEKASKSKKRKVQVPLPLPELEPRQEEVHLDLNNLPAPNLPLLRSTSDAASCSQPVGKSQSVTCSPTQFPYGFFSPAGSPERRSQAVFLSPPLTPVSSRRLSFERK